MALQCDGKAVRGLLWSFLHHLLPGAHWWHSATPSSSPGLCLARCTNPNRIYTNTYTDACVGFEEMSFSSQPRMQSKYYSRNVFLGCSGFFRRIEFQMTTMTRRLKCWLSALAAVVHVHIIQTAGRAVQKKKKKRVGGATISRQFIKFQCKHPRITAKGQCFNIAASVSFQTRARSLKREETSPSPNTIWLRWWCVYGDSSSLWQKSLPLRTALSRAPM